MSATRAPRIPAGSKARLTSKQYKEFLNRGNAPSYRVVEVRLPELWSEGERLNPHAALGEHIPPVLEHGWALQGVTQIDTFMNVVLDPDSFTFYTVAPIESANRTGRVKPTPDAMKSIFRRDNYLAFARIGATRSSGNYWHWIVETMPRLMRMQQDAPSEVITVQRMKLPFHNLKANFPKLDVNTEELKRYSFIEEAVVPTLTTRFAPAPALSRHMIPSEDVLIFPKAVQEPVTKTRRLFLSRRDVNTRVLNEEARLCQELERRGFDCLVMSDLSGTDQARLCSEAEIIISTHGAGMSNMLYRAGRPCTVVEVVPLRHWPHTNLISMYNLSALSGFRHIVYDCSYPSEEIRLLSQNWAIDIDKFLKFVDGL